MVGNTHSHDPAIKMYEIGRTLMSFSAVVDAWPAPEAKVGLKQCIENLGEDALPLQQGLQFSSVPSNEPVTAVVLVLKEHEDSLLAKVSVFYSGLIAGCACDDDPAPQETIAEHCELSIRINKETGETEISLLESA